MASCCLLLFFVFLSLSLSEEACYDHFSREKWNGKDMTDLIPLINSTSPEKILNCTIWKNIKRELFANIIECFNNKTLEETCKHTTEGNHKMYMFHFRCLFAKVRNVNYEDKYEKEIFGDCQYFSSEIKTMEWLWSSSDGTSAGAPSTSPPTTTTLTPTTTSTISTPTTSTSRKTSSLITSSTTTSTSSSTTTSMSPRTTMLTTSMLKSLSTTTSTTSPTTTSTSGRTTTLTTSPPTTSTLTSTTTSTISTPTKSTSRNTTSSSATTSMSPRTTTSTRSLTTTSRSSLTTRSTDKGQTQWSNTTTPMDVEPCLACHCKSGPNMGRRAGPTTETSSTHTGQTACILVALMLSIIGNLMQGLNSFLQKRRLKKQKEMSVERISLNPDATAAEKSPEKSLSHSNETVL